MNGSSGMDRKKTQKRKGKKGKNIQHSAFSKNFESPSAPYKFPPTMNLIEWKVSKKGCAI